MEKNGNRKIFKSDSWEEKIARWEGKRPPLFSNDFLREESRLQRGERGGRRRRYGDERRSVEGEFNSIFFLLFLGGISHLRAQAGYLRPSASVRHSLSVSSVLPSVDRWACHYVSSRVVYHMEVEHRTISLISSAKTNFAGISKAKIRGEFARVNMYAFL